MVPVMDQRSCSRGHLVEDPDLSVGGGFRDPVSVVVEEHSLVLRNKTEIRVSTNSSLRHHDCQLSLQCPLSLLFKE